MEDFSASAMITLIGLGLRRQGLAETRGAPPLPPAKGARVALPGKRALVEELLRRHGPVALLRMGEAIEDAPHAPALTALGLAEDPFDLLERWRRLERYSHSRHRTEVTLRDARRVVLRHKALAPHPPPRPAESLLVMGLLITLLERLGVEGLAAKPHGAVGPQRRGGGWSQNGELPEEPGVWEIRWRRRKAKSTGDEEGPPLGDVTEASRRRLLQDPGRGWTVTHLARDLGASPRSLQRRLQARGVRFSRLLLEARVAAASDQLCRTQDSPAEIGFACGFCDQAHFTRRFKEETAMTPTVFRKEFAARPDTRRMGQSV